MSSDTYYVNRCLDGHPDDFRHLVGRYQRVLLAHLVGRLGRLDAAEEAAQETLVRCYFGLSKLKKRGSFFPWMLGIGNRVAQEQQRKDMRQREALNELAEQPPPQVRGFDYPLARVIGELPDFYRELVLLRYYGGFSCKAIAEQLEMPIGTVTKTLSRACAVLREKLRRHERSGECEVRK
jgi:RNA polymerase sigma-70 factor (ECF subfamily)